LQHLRQLHTTTPLVQPSGCQGARARAIEEAARAAIRSAQPCLERVGTMTQRPSR
jgi:hypothetical protein